MEDRCHCTICGGALREWGRHPADPTGERFGDHHWPIPLPHERMSTMKYMLIDLTTVELTKVVLVADLHRVQAWGKIYKAEGKNLIAPPVEGRGFSKLDKLPLQYLYWNTCGETPPEEYADLIRNCMAKISSMPEDKTDIRELESRLRELYPDGELGLPAAPKASKPRSPAEPGIRPKATSTTGLVWELCDQALTGFEFKGDMTDWKAVRAKANELATENGIVAGTFGVQYGKWKASKLASKPA